MVSRISRFYIKSTCFAASRWSAIPLTPIHEEDEMDLEETNIYASPSTTPSAEPTTEARNAAVQSHISSLTSHFKSLAEANPTREHLGLANTMITIDHASSHLLTAISSWSTWTQTHYHQRDTFGQVDFPGFSMSKWAVLRSDIEELSEALTIAIIPLIETALELSTRSSVNDIRNAMSRYCEQVAEIGREAGGNASMVGAGFEPHEYEIGTAARDLLFETSSQ
ncbi:MAG: hypothetical protein Q9177_005522 [Variospora cf. flavescens]